MPRRISLIAAPLLAGAALLLPASGALAAGTTDVTVMTRNLFLGADLPPLAVAPQGAGFERVAGQTLAEVRAGQPVARMKLIAREIAGAQPDIVGLQEVSTWRTGPKGSPRPARHVVVDFLRTIRRELARRHAHYHVVADVRGFDVEGPTDRGVDVRLSLGDAVLAHRGVRVRSAHSGVFDNQLVFSTAQLGPISTARTWISLDVGVRGVRFRLVDSHLEAYSTAYRLAQARELVAGPLGSSRPTVLVGDLNSGPTLSNPNDRPPYEAIFRAGYRPERTQRDSCCFNRLNGSAGWNHNVDWIMARPKVPLVRSFVTGRERTGGGYHPSDHGGVVSVLRMSR
jgi:endonuclease/exonuclease/phosphatase family metal-dependent hydrolase